MLPLPTLIACTWNRQPTTALRIYNTSSVSMCKRRAHMRSILFINTSMSASCVYRTRSVCSQAATAEEMQFSLDMFDYILLSHEYVDDIQSSVKLLVVFVVSFFFFASWNSLVLYSVRFGFDCKSSECSDGKINSVATAAAAAAVIWFHDVDDSGFCHLTDYWIGKKTYWNLSYGVCVLVRTNRWHYLPNCTMAGCNILLFYSSPFSHHRCAARETALMKVKLLQILLIFS